MELLGATFHSSRRVSVGATNGGTDVGSAVLRDQVVHSKNSRGTSQFTWRAMQSRDDEFTAAGIYPPKPLTLSTASANDLELLADQLVAETLRSSDDFISQGRTVNRGHWKTVKSKNNMTTYRERKGSSSKILRGRTSSEATEAFEEGPQLPEFCPSVDKNMTIQSVLEATYLSVSGTGQHDNDTDDETPEEFTMEDILEQKVMEKSKPEIAPMVLCTGVIPGTVEDAALGFIADTEARTRVRNSKISETAIEDVRILSHIQGPSFDDPFRFLGIKWWTQSTSGAAAHFIKPRDCLVLESSGMALDADGNRFCYLLSHSISLDEVPEFGQSDYERLTFSACHIIRPHDAAGKVEVFCRGFMDPAGSFTERLSIYRFCNSLMTVPHVIDKAYSRKLAWLLEKEPRGISTLGPSGQTLATCASCCEKLNRGVGKLLDYSICILCRHSACWKCTKKTTLLLEACGSSKLTKRAMDFCLKCLLEAKELPAWQVGVSSLLVTDVA
ncbi:unnamed protein product [Phytophthora lilii]|uniref:Unnamed protein product n=1 Tax=Phytophthora lilii TaxID=2077276 RepID=A0A9W6TP85_9STRA|nr:unnamed protein product [Phytophthora lilii]